MSLTRAEIVRARRMQRRDSQPLLERASLNVGLRKAASEPQMVARNPEVERRHAAQSAVRPRRAHYLKLAEDGAQLRLPVLPALSVGARLVSGLLAAACIALLYLMASSSAFIVSEANLQGAQRLDAAAVNRALGVAGASVFAVQPDQLLALLHQQFPELERVSISVGFPAGVTVRVLERQPALAWEQAGLLVWVDAAGVAFTPQEDGESLVHVTALDAPPMMKTDEYGRHQLLRREMVSAIQILSQIAPQGAALIYDPALGFGWNDPGGWKAFFGQDGSDIVQRMAIYRSILAELAERRLTPTLVSVAELHAPYYRMDY
ncbi:MAG: FtsQ-type POTRA domain-containing protein [Anaerolineales bacterium]|nr:FtsQ-type POTRA domain-containing protein [Anaerolineales bacterium]